MPASVLHPDGLDLRMTWPERQLFIREQNYRLGRYALAEAELPPLPDFIKACGGKMPDSFHSTLYTPFAEKLSALWNKYYRDSRGHLSHEVASAVLNAGARNAYHTEWWEYEGRRVYALDPTTAFALLHTDIDDFPCAEFHLPVRSFFLRIPRELGWQFSLETMMSLNGVTLMGGLSVPLDEHPEPVQELEGFHVTADMRGAELLRLQVIIAGRSIRNPAGDHTMWIELPMRHSNLGEVIAQVLEPADDLAARTGYDIDRRFLKIILGSILYITSAHPELRAIAPQSSGTRAKALKDPARAGVAKERSRYAITYVGGPQYGVRHEPGHVAVDALTRRPPAPHMRTGHYRWQPYGPRDAGLRRHIWVQPVQIGAWDRIAAYEAQKGLRITIRKTRPAQTFAAGNEEPTERGA